MDQFFKPSLIATAIKNYLSDINRLESHDFDYIKKYRDRVFRNFIKYAYTVPLYKKKYKDAEIHPDNIRGIDDIEKLPIIRREDLVNNFPAGLIPPDTEKNTVLINTSGSTRNPVSYYMDQHSGMKPLILYVRELRRYGFRWNKSRISMIANFYSQTGPTRYFDSGAIPTLKPFFSLNNFQLLNADDDLRDMINKIDKFKPEFIAGFPGPLRHIALLRNKGHGKNINPKCFISSGGLLDNYVKKYIEETFSARVFNLYGATESGPISFECEEGNFHINSDFIYLETVDLAGEKLQKGKSGRLALTRLYGKGTPFIRYTGMGDIIKLKDGICDCGLETELIEKVHGRIKESIVLPDKKVIFPDKLADVPGKVMHMLKTEKINRIQIVQHSLNKIEVLVIMDEHERYTGASVDKFLNELKTEYEELFGSEVELEVREVTKLVSEEGREDSTPGILSKIDVNKYI